MKKLTLTVLVLLLTLGLVCPVMASINRDHIVEEIDVLDEDDAKQIEKLGEKIKKDFGVHPIFFLMKHYENDDYYAFIDEKLSDLDIEDRFLFILIDAEANEYSYGVAEELEDYIDDDFLHYIFQVYDKADTYNGGIVDAYEALYDELEMTLDGQTVDDILGGDDAEDDVDMDPDFTIDDLEFVKPHFNFELYDDDTLPVFYQLEQRTKKISEKLGLPIHIHADYNLPDEIAEYDDYSDYAKEDYFFNYGYSFDEKGIYILISEVGHVGWYATDNVLAALDETTIQGLDELAEEATVADDQIPVKEWGEIADRVLDVLEEAEIDADLLDKDEPEDEPEEASEEDTEELDEDELLASSRVFFSLGDEEDPLDETELDTLNQFLIEISEDNEAEFFIVADNSGDLTETKDIDMALDMLAEHTYEHKDGVALFWGGDDTWHIRTFGKGTGLEGKATEALYSFLNGRDLDFTTLYGYASLVKEMYPLYAGGGAPDTATEEPEATEPDPLVDEPETAPAASADDDFIYPRGDTLRDQPYMVDEAGLLTEEQVQKLNEKLDAMADTYWVDLAIITVPSLEGEYAMNYAMDYYNRHGYGFGPDDDGALFLLCPAERDYAFVTHNYGRYAIPDGEGNDRLLRDVLKKLGDDRYYEAFDKLADEAAIFFKRARNGDPYDGGTLQPEKNRAVGTPLLGILSGLGGGFGIVSAEKHKLKNVRAKISAANYALMDTRQLYRQSDRLVDTQTRVVARPKQTSSSGGGGGGSGHSSGGRSFGGSSGKY